MCSLVFQNSRTFGLLTQKHYTLALERDLGICENTWLSLWLRMDISLCIISLGVLEGSYAYRMLSRAFPSCTGQGAPSSPDLDCSQSWEAPP